MKLYKLTKQDNTTQNDTLWGEGVTHEADGKSTELCNNHWLHAYTDPLLAVIMNPAHANIGNPKLWECEGDVGLEQADKVGCTKLTTLKEIPLPQITPSQLIKFACLVAREIYPLWDKYDKDGVWLKWYDGGCQPDDAANAANAANAACYAANAASYAAYYAAYAANIKIDLVNLARQAIMEDGK